MKLETPKAPNLLRKGSKARSPIPLCHWACHPHLDSLQHILELGKEKEPAGQVTN